MLSKSFTTAAVALAAASVVSAQTSTDCNPTKQSCPADPAFGNKEAECDFTKGACSVFDELPGTTLSYNGEGAVFTINKETDAPTIRSGKYLFFGRVDYEIQAAPGQGIVTSAVLQSDDLDEIDWEWVGSDNTQVQTNYFSKGDTTTYNRGGFSSVSNPTGSVHTYSIEWTPSSLQWIIDGATVRTLTYDDAEGGKTYPQTPMQIKLGTWVAGCSSCAKGTVEWAGGYADFSQAPFKAFYKSIAITDYAGGSSAPKGAVKEYIYGDKSGTYESIKVENGSGSDVSGSSTSGSSGSSTSASSGSSTTAASKSSSTGSSADTTTTKAKTTSSAVAKNTTMATMPSTTPAKTSGSNAGTPTKSHAATATNAGSRSAAAIGSVVLAGAGILLSQLF